MLAEKIALLDGCRHVVYLQHELEEAPETFLVLRGINSETDIFPIAQAKSEQWAPEALLRLDK